MPACPKIALSVVPHSLAAAVDSHKRRWFWAVFLSCFLFLSLSPARGGTDFSTFPAEFGEVIYRCNPSSPNQLFIIGIAHRDSLTGLSIPKVARAQAEVYKLGQWLVQNERCELLLPEGFFATPATKAGKGFMKTAADEKLACPESIDLKTLEEKLSDKRSFVNAELLLKRNYSLKLRQVEEEKYHWAVGDLIGKLVNCGNDSAQYLQVRSQLDYLQEKRTAAMLQRIPEVIQAEFQQGNIKARKAIFTIGLSHLPQIIRTLEENRVKIDPPILGTKKQEVYTADLNLKKEDFGVSILLPQALAGDRRALKINGLDEMIARYRRHSSAGSSPLPRN